MAKYNDFWWHNAIDGNQNAEDIKKDARCCLDVASMLAECVEVKAITLTGGDSSPSLTRWDVLDAEAYKVICEKHGFKPKDFGLEIEDEDEEGN